MFPWYESVFLVAGFYSTSITFIRKPSEVIGEELTILTFSSCVDSSF